MQAIRGLLGSKKALMSLLGVALNAIIAFLPAEALDPQAKLGLVGGVSSIIAFYLWGQGKADEGKESKKLDIEYNRSK